MNNIILALESDSELKRLQELSAYFNRHEELKVKMNELLSLQKKLVAAKVNDLAIIKDINASYEKLKEEILDLPFVEEYFSLLDYLKVVMTGIKNRLEIELTKDFLF